MSQPSFEYLKRTFGTTLYKCSVLVLSLTSTALLEVDCTVEDVTHLTGAGIKYGVLSPPCWTSMSTHKCGSECVETLPTSSCFSDEHSPNCDFLHLLCRKIPLALENSATTPTASHRTSTNSHSSSSSSISAGFLGLSSPPPYDSKPVLSYGTTLNARSSPQASATEQPAYSGASRQVSASSPQMPSAHLSSLPSLGSNRPLKSRSGTKSFRAREPSSSLTNSIVKGSNNSSVSVSGSASGSLGSGKKRKNSSLLTSHSNYTSESSSSSSFKKNCAVNAGSLGSAYHSSLASTPSSSSSSSASSSSHSGVYSVGVNCTPGRANSLSLKQESTGRGPPSGSPAESIKRMSVVMNSSDSTLSLGPFVHQSSDHHTDARLEAKRRKGSPGSSSLNSTGPYNLSMQIHCFINFFINPDSCFI